MADYLVQEDTGDRITLEDASGFILLEDSNGAVADPNAMPHLLLLLGVGT